MNFLLSCLFGHGDRLRERLEDGTYVLRCAQCGHDQPVLPDQVYKARKVKRGKKKEKSADVLTLTRKVG
jgi:Zn ribbon nucleic-acid-binding protein